MPVFCQSTTAGLGRGAGCTVRDAAAAAVATDQAACLTSDLLARAHEGLEIPLGGDLPAER